MRNAAPLAFGQVAVLHAVAAGHRFGFDIMDATGLTSGSVYPTLNKLQSLGYLTSHWEAAHVARRTSRDVVLMIVRQGSPSPAPVCWSG